jgi:predicted phosphodiesterase
MRKWTDKEESYLRDNPSQTNAEIGKILNRSEDAIGRKRRRLGLVQEPLLTPIEQHKKAKIEKYDKQYVKKLLNEKADRDIMLDILKEIVPVIDFTPRPLPKHKKSNNKEIAVLNINDVHIGRYPIDVLEKKADELVNSAIRIVEIQRQGADISELVINFVGDIVDGDGIFPAQAYEQKFHLMEQMFGVGLPVMSNMLNELSNHFEKITINCVRGNHGRVSKFTDEDLNFDNIFYHILELATKNNPRLHWNIAKKWYMIAKISKFGFFLTHGNYIKTWLNIPFYGIKEKGMRWQGSLTKQETIKINKEWVRVQKEYWDFIVLGHFHTSLYFRWNNWRCVLGGTWLDSDDFAESVLGLDSATEQTIFGINEKRGITWMRNIDLSK